MSDPDTFMRDLSGMIVALAALIASIGGVVLGILNRKAIEVVRTDVNDKMQQFIKVTGQAEHAKGVIQGQSMENKGTEGDPIHVKVSDE